MSNLAEKPENKVIELADGKEYELAPLDWNMMVEVEEKFDDRPFGELFAESRIKVLRFTIWTILKEKYPEMTEKQCGHLLNVNVMNKVQQAIADSMG